MSSYGIREIGDDSMLADAANGSTSYMGESNCQRFWFRLMACLRESQELDVLYDCRSRLIDMRECVVRHKQSTWAMRETLLTMRNETELRKWIANYDERMGHPPLLEAVSKVKKLVEAEGGIDVLHPSVFKDPDVFISDKIFKAQQSSTNKI